MEVVYIISMQPTRQKQMCDSDLASLGTEKWNLLYAKAKEWDWENT